MDNFISRQNNLRRLARIALAESVGLFTTQDFADFLEIQIGSYYNWIHGSYDLSSKKARAFEQFLNDIVDQ